MAGVAGMNADVAGILEQMREQQRQQVEQHKELIAMMAQQQQPQQRPGNPATQGAAVIEEGTKLIPKFISCSQFNGKPENWEDFQFKFRRPIRSQSVSAHNCMSQVEGEETVVDDDIDVNVSEETSVCFFDILCQHVEGEALMVIKSVEGFHGFEAWRRLHRKYSPGRWRGDCVCSWPWSTQARSRTRARSKQASPPGKERPSSSTTSSRTSYRIR